MIPMEYTVLVKLDFGILGEVKIESMSYRWVDSSRFIDLNIIGDGTLPCGIRVHLVEESFINARLLHNAIIISKDMIHG